MNTRQELHNCWQHIMQVCCYNGKKHENVPIDDKWKTFDGFYSDNYQRYYRAKLKWKNYIKVTPEKSYKYRAKKTNVKNNHINLIRKEKKDGYTKKNTVFTSASDRMKFHKNSHRYVFDNNQLLGTRDIKNILTKKGIKRTIENIAKNTRNGKDIFSINRLDKFLWNGKYCSLKDVAIKENISLSLLKNKVFGNKMNLKNAVDYCKNINPDEHKYLFEGKMMFPNEVLKILSVRHNIKEKTLLSRFYKHNCDFDKIIFKKSESKFAPYKKKIIARKDNIEQVFESIKEASEKLGLSRNVIFRAINNKNTHTMGYTIKEYN